MLSSSPSQALISCTRMRLCIHSILSSLEPQHTHSSLLSFLGMPADTLTLSLPPPPSRCLPDTLTLCRSGCTLTGTTDLPPHQAALFHRYHTAQLGFQHTVLHGLLLTPHNSNNPPHPRQALISHSSKRTWLPLPHTQPSVDTYSCLVPPDGFSPKLFGKEGKEDRKNKWYFKERYQWINCTSAHNRN